MKFIVWSNGDPSVGIPGQQAEVSMDVDDEHISFVKGRLVECFRDLWDEKRVFAVVDHGKPESALAVTPRVGTRKRHR